eukprot:Pgem_evm1s9467
MSASPSINTLSSIASISMDMDDSTFFKEENTELSIPTANNITNITTPVINVETDGVQAHINNNNNNNNNNKSSNLCNKPKSWQNSSTLNINNSLRVLGSENTNIAVFDSSHAKPTRFGNTTYFLNPNYHPDAMVCTTVIPFFNEEKKELKRTLESIWVFFLKLLL